MNDSLVVNVGGVKIGGGNPIVVQTMCNTHTYDEEATIAQCRRLAEAGSQLIRITVPGPSDATYTGYSAARESRLPWLQTSISQLKPPSSSLQ